MNKGKKPNLPQNKTPSGKLTTTIKSFYQGPIPPPAVLEHYENIQKGLANKIVGMAEMQSTHRQEIEKDVIKADIRKTYLGQIFAFIVTTLLIGSGMYLLAFTDKVIIGTSITIPTIIINGLIFVYGKWVSRKERIRRTENLSDSKENN